MPKLKQKQWMTITEAARFLTNLSDDGIITESDILQFAMDSELTLSIRTTQQTLSPIWSAELQPRDLLSEEEQAQLQEETDRATKDQRIVMSTIIGTTLMAGLELECQPLPPHIWDINNFGPGHHYLTKLWNELQKGEIKDPNRLVPGQAKPDNNQGEETTFFDYLELIHPDHFFIFALPTHLIPNDSYLVVRKSQLEQLFEEDSEPLQDSELSTRQKKTYLKVIRALCEEHKDIDLGSHSTAASQVIAIADSLGLTIPGKRTLEILLKEARELED